MLRFLHDFENETGIRPELFSGYFKIQLDSADFRAFNRLTENFLKGIEKKEGSYTNLSKSNRLLFERYFSDYLYEDLFLDYQNQTLFSVVSNSDIEMLYGKYKYLVFKLLNPQNMFVLTGRHKTENPFYYLPEAPGILKNPERYSFRKADLLPVKAYSGENPELFVFLLGVEKNYENFFYEPAFVLANLFGSGGWVSLSGHQRTLRGYRRRLCAGYRNYREISKKIVYVDHQFYYIVKIVFDRFFDKTAERVRNNIYEKIRILKNRGLETEELETTASKTVSDFAFEYSKLPLFMYSVVSSEGYKTIFANVQFMKFVDKGQAMRIASRYFTDGQFFFPSHKDLLLSGEEFFYMMGY